MDWIGDHLTEVWLGGAVLLGVAELLSLDLVLVMLAAGALGGMVASLVTGLVLLQVVVAVVVSVAMLAVVRPGLAAKLRTGPELQVGHGKLVGQQAVVTQTITGLDPGRVKLAGETWSALPYDETLVLEPGTPVQVLEIRGATAYVHPLS